MNKKEKNKKNISQNIRNKRINHHYISSIKSQSKFLLLKIKKCFEENKNISIQLKSINKFKFLEKLQKFYSILDKSVKKNILHIKNAARKKSYFGRFMRLF